MPFSRYLPEHMGSATLTPAGPFVAGTHAEFTLTYTEIGRASCRERV